MLNFALKYSVILNAPTVNPYLWQHNVKPARRRLGLGRGHVTAPLALSLPPSVALRAASCFAFNRCTVCSHRAPINQT
ncbi:hypothetical protein D9C73_006909 [Collichthys lucidus]|uniref:Uncharacterized protein n=1 Tax=Collichthys lucidus TaxID=240159 RepID=A0A4V6ANI0_COLLU|nr:hypothetical protein D9C73_006909 [Collichthys lucidus]